MWPISPLLQSVSLQHPLLYLANCLVPLSFPSVISILCIAVAKGISVEVDSSFKPPLPKLYKLLPKHTPLLDVADDIYTYGWILYISASQWMKYRMSWYIGRNPTNQIRYAESLILWSSTASVFPFLHLAYLLHLAWSRKDSMKLRRYCHIG